MSAFIDLSGRRFGMLAVICRDGKQGSRVMWQCRCDCGTIKTVQGNHLRAGETTSCGCAYGTHKMANTREYHSWEGMVQRCTNINHHKFASYGGRGIKVCERWRSFENFFADMGTRPDGTSIDRIDNNGDYCPENCRWATRKEQQRNRRATILIECGGVTRTATEWSAETGIPHRTICQRYRAGLPAALVLHNGKLPYGSISK